MKKVYIIPQENSNLVIGLRENTTIDHSYISGVKRICNDGVCDLIVDRGRKNKVISSRS